MELSRRGRLDRKKQREGRTLARRARQHDLAPEEARDLAADRKAESGAAVLAARGPVRLLESLEDDALLVFRDADAGIGHGNRDPFAPGPQGRSFGGPDLERHAAFLGEL